MSNAPQGRPQAPLEDNRASVQPPRYSTLSLATLPTYPAEGELDIAYAGNDSCGKELVSKQAFDFCLQRKGSSTLGEAWATLRLFSVVPATLQRPRYTGGDNIEGVVLLDLKRPQTILSVSVVLRGEMLTSSRSDGAHCFLEVVIPVWDGTKDPSSKASGPSGLTVGKLQGRHTWPFSIPFPTEFPDSFAPSSKSKGQNQQSDIRTLYSTPQTVFQRGINANIQYQVTLKINTSGLFNSKHRVSATILYVPKICAPPLPPLRAAAYAGSSFLVAPGDDPTGWQPLPTFRVRATEGGITCDIECTGHIANPTTYTRGSVIPCYLVCRMIGMADSSKTRILHAFTSQNCISLDLVQRVQCHQDPRAVAGPIVGNGSLKVGQRTKSDRNHHSVNGGTVVWWTPQTHAGRGSAEDLTLITSSILEGEIHIDIGLIPTCRVPFFEAWHEIELSLRTSQNIDVAILPEGSVELPSWPVRVVTARAPGGAVPVAFTPRPPRKKQDRSVVQDVQYESTASAGLFL